MAKAPNMAYTILVFCHNTRYVSKRERRYLAVCPSVRGIGVGSDILTQRKEFYSPRGIFVEIESVFAECDNIDERMRRKEFYIKNGMTSMKGRGRYVFTLPFI